MSKTLLYIITCCNLLALWNRQLAFMDGHLYSVHNDRKKPMFAFVSPVRLSMSFNWFSPASSAVGEVGAE